MNSKSSYPEKRYIIDNKKGIDIFILSFSFAEPINLEDPRNTWNTTSFYSNIPILELESSQIKVLIESLLDINITEEQMDKNVIAISEEIISIPGIEKYYLGEEVLIDGRYSDGRVNIYESMSENINFDLLKLEAKPITNIYNSLYFNYFKYEKKEELATVIGKWDETIGNYIAVDRSFFERNLINDDLKNAYLECYNKNNHYYIYIESELDNSISFGFILFSSKDILMVYLLLNVKNTPSRICDKYFPTEIRELRPIFNKHDIANIYFGDNEGEYDSEIGNVLIKLFYSNSDNKIREIILEVFKQWFSNLMASANDITINKIYDLADELAIWLMDKRKGKEGNRWFRK